MSEIRKNQTEKEKEIMSQLKARIQEIEKDMIYDFEWDDDVVDDELVCRCGPCLEIKYEFWIEDEEIKYEISLLDNFNNEYFVDDSKHSMSYQFDQINEVADLIYNFAE